MSHTPSFRRVRIHVEIDTSVDDEPSWEFHSSFALDDYQAVVIAEWMAGSADELLDGGSDITGINYLALPDGVFRELLLASETSNYVLEMLLHDFKAERVFEILSNRLGREVACHLLGIEADVEKPNSVH